MKKDDFTRELALRKVVGRCGPGSRAASLAAASAASFPGMFEWPGIHCTMIVASDFASLALIVSEAGL